MSWHRCNVTAAGPSAGDLPSMANAGVLIQLRDTANPPAFTNDRWFFADPSKAKEMLATALAALTSGLIVGVDLVKTDEYSTINRIYLLRG